MIDVIEHVAYWAIGPVFLVGVLCLFSAHIPGLRHLTGAAPLEKEPPQENAERQAPRPMRRTAAAALVSAGRLRAASAFVLALVRGRYPMLSVPGKDTRLGESTRVQLRDGE